MKRVFSKVFSTVILWYIMRMSGVLNLAHKSNQTGVLSEVFAWKQLSYYFDRVLYTNDTDVKYNPNAIHFIQELNDSEKFFIKYNNVPIGMEVYGDRIFVTVPRRRYGIPSTLNVVCYSSSSPPLEPYPSSEWANQLVSVYRPRVDQCGRLWLVDTGMIEVPGERRQVQPPAILTFDLKTDQLILKYELKSTDLVDERTPAGLTSITVDVDPAACADAYVYINDLATEGMIVFSMKERDSWRLDHENFGHEVSALNFSVADYKIPWTDGLFSIALGNAGANKKAYFHPLVSTNEYSIDTEHLKKNGDLRGKIKLLGSRGPNSQSGSHAYHPETRTLVFSSVAQNALMCWNVDTALPGHVIIIAQHSEKLLYISDLKIVGDEVWVLVNKIPVFVFSRYNQNENNFYIHRGKIRDLIRGTACEHSPQ